VLQQRRRGFFVHPSIGVKQGSHARFFGHHGHIEHVLVKDGGLVVGERYGIAPYPLGQFDSLHGADGDALYFLKASLGEVPVLAKLAAVVATGRAGAKDGRSGPKVKGRLFFDGVYLQGAGVGVDQGVVAAADVDLVPAKALLLFRDNTSPPAHLTLHLIAIQLR
jgi:hypothetical protein